MARSATLENGDTLTLTCAASGGLNNFFYWFKDADFLDQSSDGILNVGSVAATDGGLYECVVNNTAGNSSVDITIYGRACMSHNILYAIFCSCLVAPQFITVPQDVEEFIVYAINLPCSADGFPAPDIMWTFQGMNFTSVTVNSTNSTYAESTIVIDNLTLSDGGTYECIIDSDAIGMSRHHNATVSVIGGMYISLCYNLITAPHTYCTWKLLEG